MSLSLYIFWLLSNRQGYFLTFSASDSSWLNKSGGFLNLFSWLLYSESISISILLNLSFKRWFPLWIKQRLHWFRKSTIITIRIIFIFHLTNCWFLHCLMVEIIVVYKIYLAEIKMNTKKFDMMFFLFLFSKLQKKVVKTWKKSKNFWEMSLFVGFLILPNRQRYFSTFLASDSSWLNKSGGFLILFSWRSFSESFSTKSQEITIVYVIHRVHKTFWYWKVQCIICVT